jgi:glycosyltransferase involved in cell wall biosynthesis
MVVTVLIPARNEEVALAAAIESVLAQGVPALEVLVVDDHSTDRTVDVARRFPGVRVVPNAGRGLVDAMNTGLRSARGEIVVCLDADDRQHRGAIDALVAPMRADGDVDLVAGGTRFVDEAGHEIARQAAMPTADHARVVALSMNPIHQSAVAVRSSAVLEVGGYRRDGETEGGLDYDLWSRMLDSDEIEYVGVAPIVCDRAIRRASMSVIGRDTHVARSDEIRLRNRVRWSSSFSSVSAMRTLMRDLDRPSVDPNAREVFALGLFRLGVALLAEGRVSAALVPWSAGLTSNPIRFPISVVRGGRAVQARRRSRGWSMWRR